MILRRGMSDASVAPEGLQPPWYCGMPPFSLLPSCVAAFSADVGAAVGGAAGTVVQGVKSGASAAYNAVVSPDVSTCDPADFWCNYGTYVIFGGVAVAAIAFLLPPGRRRRR